MAMLARLENEFQSSLLRHVRDEAHRFAITYHRRLRTRRSLSSSLDEIPGVGPKRKKALIKRFGSLKELSRASVEEIAALPEIPRTLAERIAEILGSRSSDLLVRLDILD